MVAWTIVQPSMLETALAMARGGYQRSIVMGHEAWSGSTLRGKAREWGGRYAASRKALSERLQLAGLAVGFATIERRRVLVIGEPAWVARHADPVRVQCVGAIEGGEGGSVVVDAATLAEAMGLVVEWAREGTYPEAGCTVRVSVSGPLGSDECTITIPPTGKASA